MMLRLALQHGLALLNSDVELVPCSMGKLPSHFLFAALQRGHAFCGEHDPASDQQRSGPKAGEQPLPLLHLHLVSGEPFTDHRACADHAVRLPAGK